MREKTTEDIINCKFNIKSSYNIYRYFENSLIINNNDVVELNYDLIFNDENNFEENI